MNWKTYVAAQNAKAFVLPPGWDSREDIAEQLGCAPDRVREQLQPGIAAREIESRQFPVWDAELGRKIAVTAYRRVNGRVDAESPVKAKESATAGHPRAWSEADIRAAHAFKAQGDTYRTIAGKIGRTPLAVKRWFSNHK